MLDKVMNEDQDTMLNDFTSVVGMRSQFEIWAQNEPFIKSLKPSNRDGIMFWLGYLDALVEHEIKSQEFKNRNYESAKMLCLFHRDMLDIRHSFNR